jgi:hypothetical protein
MGFVGPAGYKGLVPTPFPQTDAAKAARDMCKPGLRYLLTDAAIALHHLAGQLFTKAWGASRPQIPWANRGSKTVR